LANRQVAPPSQLQHSPGIFLDNTEAAYILNPLRMRSNIAGRKCPRTITYHTRQKPGVGAIDDITPVALASIEIAAHAGEAVPNLMTTHGKSQDYGQRQGGTQDKQALYLLDFSSFPEQFKRDDINHGQTRG